MVSGAQFRNYMWLGWFLVGCAPNNVPECVTPLGIEILGTVGNLPSPYACEDFDLVEAEMVAEIPETEANGIQWSRLRGYRLMLYPSEKWEAAPGLWVAGRAWCPFRYIEIGTSPHHLAWTAFTHEIAHAAQGCYAAPPIDEGLDAEHANWYREGIYQATNNIAARHR